jgi:hypothetical protein
MRGTLHETLAPRRKARALGMEALHRDSCSGFPALRQASALPSIE